MVTKKIELKLNPPEVHIKSKLQRSLKKKTLNWWENYHILILNPLVKFLSYVYPFHWLPIKFSAHFKFLLITFKTIKWPLSTPLRFPSQSTFFAQPLLPFSSLLPLILRVGMIKPFQLMLLNLGMSCLLSSFILIHLSL